MADGGWKKEWELSRLFKAFSNISFSKHTLFQHLGEDNKGRGILLFRKVHAGPVNEE